MATNKTIAQTKRKYRIIQYSTFAGEFVSVATPFVIVAISNYEKYFVEYSGTKMSIAFFMALAVMGFAIWGITKKKLQNSFVTFIMGWTILAFIFQMLGSMITDLATIMWFGLIGLCGAWGLDEISGKMKSKVEEIKKAEKQAESDKLVEQVKVEQAIKEENKKKIKVKVKKSK